MRLVVDFFQSLDTRVGVDLGGTERGVAQQFLNRTEVGAGVKHVRGERMAERMHPEPIATDRVEHAVDDALDSPRRQPPPSPAQENGPTVAPGPRDHRLPEVKIAPQGEHCPRADRNDPLLPSLAATFT